SGGLSVEDLALDDRKAETKSRTRKAVVFIEMYIWTRARPELRRVGKRETKVESTAARQTQQRHTPVCIACQHAVTGLIARLNTGRDQRSRIRSSGTIRNNN